MLTEGGQVIGLIALGAVEQHGPHLPLATDALIAKYLAKEIAGRIIEPVVVAPMLPGGMSWHHLGFPGTVHLGEEVVSGFVRAYVDALAKLGIGEIAIFTAHGGNFSLIARLAADYAQAPRPRVIAYDDLPRYLSVMTAAAEAAGLKVPETDAHAGGLETSQMMFLLGEDRIEVPEVEGYTDAEPGWLDKLLAEGMKPLSSVGILGRPQGASAKVGKAICDALVDELVEWMVQGLELERPLAVARGR
jgi:creatinine amidohydrolase